MFRPLALSTALLLLLACYGESARGPEIAVRVGYVAVDPRSNSPVVVLEEVDGTRVLPIWIGEAEARSIASELREVEPVRPQTHDLAKRLIEGLEGRVDRVVVTELSEGIYYALLFLAGAEGTVEIDARPSDAIAIALRARAPVFVREGVFDASAASDGMSSPGQRI